MIELLHLTKTYGGAAAIADVSLEVGAGEAVALLGPNGSGKTTTLKCIAGLVAPSAGSVCLAGTGTPANPACRALISYLPQHVAFEEQLSAREVLEFFRKLRRLPRARVDEMIDTWALGDFLGRPVGELSGGMIQRLGIAVALLPDAPVLLLDEPTANLDPEMVLLFRRGLEEWKAAGKAILFASHTLADAEAAADRVVIFLGGRVAAVEPLQSLRSRLRSASLEEVYLRYVEERAGGADALARGSPV